MKMKHPTEYVEKGLVTAVKHETEPYTIYNYSKECSYSGAWDDITLMCRGLILHNETDEIIARPFKKFFNYEEHIAKNIPIPNGTPLVYDKLDGSLGILYFGREGKPYIATRGSFYSEQAIWATQWFRERADSEDFPQELTFLFEIIYPENRIVVDYKGYSGLDLLAVVDTKTGNNVILPELTTVGKVIEPIPFTSFEELKSRNTKNSEGFVLFWPESGARLKLKFEDYVRLHKIITGLSEKGLWEMLRDGKTLDEVLVDIPEEMLDWAKSVCAELICKFATIEFACMQVYNDVVNYGTRKKQAQEIIQRSKYPKVIFAMLDLKDHKKIIWNIVRPFGTRTFRRDLDA